MRTAVSIALVGLGLVLASPPVLGHDLRPIFMDVAESSNGTVILRWKVPATVARNQLPVAQMSAGCELQNDGDVIRTAETYQTQRQFSCESGLTGQALSLEFPGANPSLTTVIRVRTLENQILSGLLAPGELSWTIPEAPGRWAVARNYTDLGLEHIWLGWDHLLFVACLVLIARSGRRTLITVTGFTLAHSLTLALSTLNLVTLPVAAVEAAIALSILFVASEIARRNESTLTYRYPVLVASSFGLLHGFGFASVLREVGLPPTELPTALAFFNVGVEIGQVAFVLVIFGCVRAARLASRLAGNQTSALALGGGRAGLVTAYAIGTVGSFWTLERVLAFWG